MVVVDLASLRGNPATLMRNITREPSLEKVRLAFVNASHDTPAELREEARAIVLHSAFAEGELRTGLLKLLEVEQATEGRSAAIVAEPDAPEVLIAAPPAGAPKQLLPGHVLLVEDNPVNRQVAQRILGLIGLSMEMAENGKEALERLDTSSFDAVLMDCQMPVMDGYTATRMRRSHEAEGRTPRVPIIAMTANAMAGDREKCLAAGMDDYLSKPLNRGLLEQTLRKWLPANARSRPQSMPPAAAKPAVPARPAAVVAPVAVSTLPSVPAVTLAENQVGAEPLARRGPAALDQEVISDLLDVMGEEFTDLVRVYLEDAPKSIVVLEQAAARQDINALIAPSHSLKSTSANLGALNLAELAKRIEHGARSGTLKDAAPVVRALTHEYGRVVVDLQHLLAKSGA